MNKINISFKNYNEDHYFVKFTKDNKNIALDLELCEFSADMTHWEIPTQVVEKDNEVGFLISKKVSKERIELEIDRFINEYELNS